MKIRGIREISSFGLVVLFIFLAFAPLAGAQEQKTLTIFAASSLTDAFNEIKTAFERANPGVTITYSFGASSTLATQLSQGAPADIFASANATQMNNAVKAGRIAGRPRTFARNRLVLIVPADNPAKITSLKDLAKPGIKLVIAAKNVPVRDYTNTMLDRLAKIPGYGEDYKTAFLKNVVSEEDNVRQVSAKVALGEADAAFVYRSDVTPDIAGKVTIIQIPDAVNTIATYPIAVTDNSPHPDLARQYIDYVLSDEGQNTLVKWNFISIRIPALPATISLPSDGALHVGGQVLNPLKLTADDLRNTYAAQKADVTYLSGDQTVKASFTGVYLRDILDAAQVNFNADVKNDKLSMYVVATGTDGYQAIIALAEIDADFGNQPVLVAYDQDGKALTDTGPLRLVVPGDKHGGRYVSSLVSLEVRRAPLVGK
jgi:molybdate transport system substrate-binding protein